MKISIDITDFYLDEDHDLETGLKNYIKHEAICSIFSKIKEKVENEINKQVASHVLDNLSAEISKCVCNGKVPRKNSPKELVTINEYVQDCLLSSSVSSWQNFENSIKEISKKFCEEMKKRYDLNFASNIVAKLIDNKLIKEDAVKMLLGEKK